MNIFIALALVCAFGLLSFSVLFFGLRKPKIFFLYSLVLIILWPEYIGFKLSSLPSIGIDRLITLCLGFILFASYTQKNNSIPKFNIDGFLYLFLLCWFCLTAVFTPFELLRPLFASINWFFIGPLLGLYIHTFMKNDSSKVIKYIFIAILLANMIGFLELILQKPLFGDFIITTTEFNKNQGVEFIRSGIYRVKSVFWHPLVFAQFILVGVCINYYYYFNLSDVKLKILCILYLIASYILLFNTGSRAGFYLSILIPFIYFYFKLYTVSKFNLFLKGFNLISIPIVLIGSFYLISNSLDDARNIESLFIAGEISVEETSTLARVVQLDKGWEAIKNRPILGVGLTNAGQAISRNSVDNYYLSIFIETGIVGFGILLFLLYRRISLGIKGIKHYKDPLLICLLCSCAAILLFYFILSIARANLILFPLLALINLRYKELQGINNK